MAKVSKSMLADVDAATQGVILWARGQVDMSAAGTWDKPTITGIRSRYGVILTV
jgi:hypothetical protein